jgi:hypothetical protein
MTKIICDVLKSDWPNEFKKHILLKELLWKLDAPRGVKGDNSQVKFSAKAMALWKKNEKDCVNPRSGLVIEHAVPRVLVCAALMELKKPSPESIAAVLSSMIVRVAVTKDEDTRLDRMKLRQQMPGDWDGIDPMARHLAAKIKHVDWLPSQYERVP